MQQASDDLVWNIIKNGFCSFKLKVPEAGHNQEFCRNEYNVTGLCTAQACPLANSQYATVREVNGKCVLFLKHVERAHMPAKWWIHVPLPSNIDEAKKVLKQHLQYWNPFYLRKCSTRVERIHDYQKNIETMRNGDMEKHNVILSARKRKAERRDRNREVRAQQVARLESTIEQELIERLKTGVYGDIYNVNQQAFQGALNKMGGQVQELEEENQEEYQDMVHFVAGEEEEEELEYEYEEDLKEKDMEDMLLVHQPKKRNDNHQSKKTEQLKKPFLRITE